MLIHGKHFSLNVRRSSPGKHSGKLGGRKPELQPEIALGALPRSRDVFLRQRGKIHENTRKIRKNITLRYLLIVAVLYHGVINATEELSILVRVTRGGISMPITTSYVALKPRPLFCKSTTTAADDVPRWTRSSADAEIVQHEGRRSAKLHIYHTGWITEYYDPGRLRSAPTYPVMCPFPLFVTLCDTLQT